MLFSIINLEETRKKMKKIIMVAFSLVCLGILAPKMTFASETTAYHIGSGGVTIPQPQVNEITTKDTHLTGTANYPALVVVVANNQVYKANVEKNGSFSVDLEQTFPEGTVLTVYQNHNGESSAKLMVTVKKGQDIKPTAPVVDTVYTSSTRVTGTAQANHAIRLTLRDKLYFGRTDDSGAFSINIEEKLKEGEEISVVSEDDAGQDSEPTVVYVKSDDIPTPTTPTVDPIFTSSLKITGTAQADHTIIATIDEKQYKAQSDSSGAYSITLDHTLSVNQKVSVISEKDDAQSSPAVVYVKDDDSHDLSKPEINNVTENDTSATGIADPNVHIHFQIGTDSYQTVTDLDGKFTVHLDTIYKVGTPIEVYAFGDKGNQSETLKTEVVAGAFDLGIDYITSGDTILTGNTKPNAKITAVVGDRIYNGVADATGLFAITLSKAYAAGTTVTVTATDPDSGISNQKSVIVYPKLVTINSVAEHDSSITGKADPNAEVEVTVSGKSYYGKADAAGSFIVNVSSEEIVSGNVVSVSQTVNDLHSMVATVTVN